MKKSDAIQHQLQHLKAAAYDEIAQVELHQGRLQQINAQISQGANALAQALLEEKSGTPACDAAEPEQASEAEGDVVSPEAEAA